MSARCLTFTALVLIAPFVIGQAEQVPPSVACRSAVPESQPAVRAREAFEKLKSLAGDWEGKSTNGWTERVSYRVISGGSVLMELSFGAHPNEWMATMIHPDGDRLILTHYCVAKNQPRLVATDISTDLKTITFEFLDGTNLPTRNKGHMDKVVFKIEDPDHFRSHWTWYQDGKENWLEEIEHRRIKDAPTSSFLSPAAAKQSTETAGQGEKP